MPKLIGFAGYQGSGKDTCADFLCADKGYLKYAFADPVKLYCGELFGLTHDQLWGHSKNKEDDRYGHSPRQLLQKFGTDFVREMVSKQFWTNKFIAWFLACTKDVVVSDVRFQDEVDVIRGLGGVVYMIERRHIARTDGHISEKCELHVHVDGVVDNDGNLNDLRRKIQLVEQNLLSDR